jgi:hypothetical protein
MPELVFGRSLCLACAHGVAHGYTYAISLAFSEFSIASRVSS